MTNSRINKKQFFFDKFSKSFISFFKKYINFLTRKYAEKSSPIYIKDGYFDNKFIKNKDTFSQCYQDIFAELLLKNSNKKIKKVYAEIGANHPFDDSNTFVLEKKGFSGYSFDIFKHPFWKERKNSFFENGFSNKEKYINFFMIDPPKTVYVNGNPIHSSCFNSTNRSTIEKYKSMLFPDSLICEKEYKLITINNFWSKNKLNIPDVMFIDTEGNELSILKGGTKVIVEVPIIFIENNCDFLTIILIRNFMKINGFRLIARLGNLDDVFINKRFFKNININYLKKEIKNL